MSLPHLVTRHVVGAVICLAGITAAGGKRTPVDATRLTLGADGLGPVKVGMPVAEAERALGFPLPSEPGNDAAECHYVENRARLPGAAFMVVGDRVVRVDVWEPGVRTAPGIQVGSTEDEVVRAYSDVVVDPSPYAAQGHTLRVEADDGAHAIVFETDGREVVGFRGGERGAVGAIEGCE